MDRGRRLFTNSQVDLAAQLGYELNKITNAVENWDADSLLSVPEGDVCESLEQDFFIAPVALDRDNAVIVSAEDGFTTIREFDEDVRVPQTIVTISVPFTGDSRLLDLKPSSFTYSPPIATVRQSELELYWMGPRGHEPHLVRQGLDKQLDAIEKWLGWSRSQVDTYNEQAKERIATEVRDRKGRVLANRSLEASLGFPLRKRPDAETYSVPITRKQITPRRPAPASEPFRPEPSLDEDQYEAALEVLRNQRNQLERTPSVSAGLDEEGIRDLLLLGLNGQFKGQAAGEVFNRNGKTDILIRVDDRQIFIGECKIWKSPATITEALDQLLGYLVWRDTKAALLLFIRAAAPMDAINKAVKKIREHPNYKRDGRHATDERHDFVIHANDDPNREIRLAFLPFHLPKSPEAERE